MTEEKFKEKFQENGEKTDQENKSYGVGIRHLQMFCMTLTMVCLFIARASMGIAILAMSDDSHHIKSRSNNTYHDTTARADINISYSYSSYNSSHSLVYHNDSNYSDSIDSTTDIYTTHIDDFYVNNTYSIIARNDTSNDTLHVIIEKTNDLSGIVRFQWDKKTQSLILASFFWGYLLMQIPAGILARKFGGKPILLVALVSNSIICCLVPTFASVGGWMLVCACRTAMGLTQACLFPASHTLLGQWLPDNERTSYVGIVYAGMQLGTIIAMPVCGALAETAIGWKLIFYVIAILLFLNGLVWYWFAASSPREHRLISMEERLYIEAGLNVSEKRPPTPWKHILRSGPMWVLLAPHIGFAMSFILFFVDMPTYMEKALKISLKDSSILSALPYIGMWIGSIFSSFLSEWMLNKKLVSLTVSRKIFQSIAQMGAAVGLIILSFLGPDSKSLAVVTLVGILTASGFASAGFMVNQLDLSPNNAGVIIALLNFIANFGSVLMPIATSYILQNDSSNVPRWKWVFLFMAAFTVSTNIVHLVFGTSKRQAWDDPNFLKDKNADPEELQPVLKKKNNDDKETDKTAQCGDETK